MPKQIRVAVIQLYAEPLDHRVNFKKASDFVRSAAAQGAQLAVLPEYHLLNWLPKDPSYSDLCGECDQYLPKYQALAKELSICIVPGTIVERIKDPDTAEDKLINVAYFIGNTGTILSQYTKKNLWHPERPHLESSTHEPHIAFDTPLGRVGMLICWDLAFPEAFRELIADGAQIIVIPCFWTLNDCSAEGRAYNPSAEALFLDAMLTARAFENTCAIVFANAGGPPGQGYCGLSQVTLPFIGPITKLGSGFEGMSVVDLDMSILDVAEKNYQVRKDLAREDWHYTYRHDSFAGRETSRAGRASGTSNEMDEEALVDD